ncbi:MAG TPA: PTS sugar transporter subunit IIC [Longimicrobiales bacterium]|nr:PTS sugar transporter subunit IIC [Longimicrobiales bacterium]
MELLQVSVLGGLLALDATSVGQVMVSRPLVAGVIAGLLVREPALGATIGAVLELYLLVSFPTGGSRFPEGATATVVAVASASLSPLAGALPLAVAVGLLWGQLGGFSITGLRHLNARIVPQPTAEPGRPAVAAAHLAAVALDFARGALVTLTGVLVGRAVVRAAAGGWSLAAPASTGLLLLGAAVSLGILLRDLGGLRARLAVFVAGLALGALGARIL